MQAISSHQDLHVAKPRPKHLGKAGESAATLLLFLFSKFFKSKLGCINGGAPMPGNTLPNIKGLKTTILDDMTNHTSSLSLSNRL